MKNSKTTITGLLTLGAAIITVIVSIMNGGDVGSVVSSMLVPALAGIGLINASDGGVELHL